MSIKAYRPFYIDSGAEIKATERFSEPRSALHIPQMAIRKPISSPLVDCLNMGPIPNQRVSRGQPHKGNLFDHLYSRKSFQRAYASV
jgi:hypothetical protein